ncbi:hypothetical protein Poli38472_007619 [Pythium oligandrum]|uniref:Uncharacterized protein n=1 Tax=Pythium oligandrum TaxID=41045 RepID=A0A8K1CSI1_PYTOL|nr:hypothetical protein Poli38472_007619 [Pythium oligandrum]|eukprot:TMW67947.1 hypothetical protein Poli38472_007619 [Pythium oligandrum]
MAEEVVVVLPRQCKIDVEFASKVLPNGLNGTSVVAFKRFNNELGEIQQSGLVQENDVLVAVGDVNVEGMEAEDVSKTIQHVEEDPSVWPLKLVFHRSGGQAQDGLVNQGFVDPTVYHQVPELGNIPPIDMVAEAQEDGSIRLTVTISRNYLETTEGCITPPKRKFWQRRDPTYPFWFLDVQFVSRSIDPFGHLSRGAIVSAFAPQPRALSLHSTLQLGDVLISCGDMYIEYAPIRAVAKMFQQVSPTSALKLIFLRNPPQVALNVDFLLMGIPRWYADVIQSAATFFVTGAIVGANLHQVSSRPNLTIAAADMSRFSEVLSSPLKTTAVGIGSFTRTNTMNTILRRAILPSQGATQVCYSTNANQVGNEHTNVGYNFVTSEWIADMIPNGVEPREVFVVPGSGRSSGTQSTKSSLTASEASTIEDLITWAVYSYVKAVAMRDTTQGGARATELANLGEEVIKYRLEQGINYPMEPDDPVAHLENFLYGLFRSNPAWESTLNIIPADIEVEHATFDVSRSVDFSAVTINIPLNNAIWHRRLKEVNAVLVEDGSVYSGTGDVEYEIAVANECGPLSCGVQNRGLAPEQQVFAFPECSTGFDCASALYIYRMLLFGVGRRIEGDSFELFEAPANGNVALRKAVVRNPREYHTISLGRMVHGPESLGFKFGAYCLVGDRCEGLTYTIDKPNKSVQYLVAGKDYLPFKNNFQGLDIRRDYGVQLLTRYTPSGRVDYEILRQENFKQWIWPTLLVGDTCSPKMERSIDNVRLNYIYMEHPLQTVYTAGMYFIFQGAQVVETFTYSNVTFPKLRGTVETTELRVVVPLELDASSLLAVFGLLFCGLVFEVSRRCRGRVQLHHHPTFLVQALLDKTIFPDSFVSFMYYIDYEVIDLMNYRFEASERIELRVDQATKTVTCHAVELYVYDVSVEVPATDKAEKKTLACEQIQYITADESVTFHFAEALPAGAVVTLSLKFHGFLNDKQHGFYRTEYELEGDKRMLAVTQFQPCDARRAFVCWDEPAIKARYEMSMVTDVDLTALSNTHVVQTQIRPKKNAHLRKLTRKDKTTEKYWKFAETPIMSTYLVAMVVGEFDLLTDVTPEGVIVNVYTAPGQTERGRFSLDVAVRGLSFFTEQFGIPYPLKKLDMVAVPDFLGAMENWGLVPYGDSYIYVDEKLTSHKTKVDVACTVCHELSHQWFGNLVTMDWWTGLWLNEGFAQYMEFDAVDAIFPEWKVWESFVQNIQMSSALVKDAMATSHPVEVEVNHPSEVNEIFDAITYHKGASVVRMLAEYLGRDVFYKGVHNYLVKYSYQNTKTEDVWAAFEETSGQKITQMASSWTKQTGYPIVTVNEESGRLTLAQERFFSDLAMKKDDATLWDVPLTLITAENPTETKRIGIWDAKSTVSGTDVKTPVASSDAVNAKLNEAVLSSPAWIKLNPNQSSYFLVNYTPSLWKKLETPVKDRTLDVVDRMSLVNSIYALANAGVVSVVDALEFTSAYTSEPEYLCWKEISTSLAHYSSLFSGESFYPKLQAYIRELFGSVMKRLTWDATEEDKANSDTSNFRAIVIARLGAAGDASVIEEAQKRVTTYLSGDKSTLSADLRGAAFRIHAAATKEPAAAAALVKQLQDLYEQSDLAEEKVDCLSGLGAIPDLGLKKQVLEWCLEKVQATSVARLFANCRQDDVSTQMVWEFATAQYDTIEPKYSMITFGSIICGTVSCFRSEEKAQEVEAFLKTKNVTPYARRLDGAYEKLRLNAKQFGRDRDALEKWLEQRST